MRTRAFTLLELLVVVGIITIVLGIALPNYRSARVRAEVAAAHGHLKNIQNALDWYASDHYGSYPPTSPFFPTDPLALLSNHQLRVLTTPIQYISEESLVDPFGLVEAQILEPVLSGNNDFPKLVQPNEDRSLLYFHYPSLARKLQAHRLHLEGSATVSIGPDRKDSLGAYRPFDSILFSEGLSRFGFRSPLDTVYCPTNGTLSTGDISRFVGIARQFRFP